MKSIRMLFLSLLAAALLITGAQFAMAQTAQTGALSGTVTDPSGAVISGATVTATNIGNGQARTVTTDSNGSYKISQLPPGNYSVKFSSAGFETVTVPSVTVNVTETAVFNQSLQVGGQTTQVTVEATAQAIQTENVTNGGVVSGEEITALPLVSRNYTQIINLSPGVVANAATASSIGNGTQDVSANGSTANQNNYSMNGSSIVNYVSGMAAQEGSFPGIAIPNPDAIQEFKVQTSQYDASSGRNPGANVDVVTKTGTNQFHGAAWEFNRNNFFNANDYFYRRSEAAQGIANTPQTLKQNTFGFTLGGPIIKNKAHFFGSYQGFRQLNGIGTSGFASGYSPNTFLMPWNDYADAASGVCSDVRCSNNVAAYKAYLGNLFQGQAGFFSFAGGTGVPINGCTDPTCNSTNITNTAVALLQAKGVVKGGFNQGFYFPSMTQQQVSNFLNCPNNAGSPFAALTNGCRTAISDPTRANEDQYIADGDYAISTNNTIYARYMYQRDPQIQPFNCFILAGNCNPGAPLDAYYGNHVGQLELRTILTPNLVNDAHFDFHRDIENNTDPNSGLKSCSLPNGAMIQPLAYNGAPCGSTPPALVQRFPEMAEPPMLDILGIGGAAWSQGGNFSMVSSNFVNTYQWSDQVSWNHGRHSLRAGFEGGRVLYNNTIPAAERGELLMFSTADFLTSSSGLALDGTPATPTGGIVLGFGLKGTLTHYNRVNQFDWYVQDDIKVSPKLTVNLGLRWEYAGFPDDKSGQFSNVWQTQLVKVNTGSALQALGTTGTLVGFAVPSNFDKNTFGLTSPSGATGVTVNSNKTLVPGTPLHDFAPRIGVAWQPLGQKLVVRAGYGWFYDTIYGNLLIDNQLNLPPYSGAGAGPAPLNQENTLQNPWLAGVGPLVWTPRYMFPGAVDPNVPGNPPCPAGICSSGFGYTSDSPTMADRLPLVQQYSLDLQYDLGHNWIADVGYIGSHGIHLYDWSRNINVARLVAGAPNGPTAASGPQNLEMVASSLPYNDAANPNPITTNEIGTFTTNINERVSYLGFAPGGVASTDTLGDHLYNSLQTQLRHQFSKGFLLQVSYTWSKEMTNINTSAAGSGIQPPGEVIFGAANSNDPLDLGQQYGPAAFNRTQRAVISYVYRLPYTKTEGLSGKLLGGWSLSGVTTIQNGLPFWIVDGGGATIYGAGSARAALADPIDCNATRASCKSGIPIATAGSTHSRVNGTWVNPSAFISLSPTTYGAPNALGYTPLPASSPYCIGGTPNPGPINPNAACGQFGAPFLNAGTGYGNSAIGSITGPGQFNFDMSLIKTTKLWEGGSLEFHLDAFNIFNHAQFNPPGNDLNTASTFGIITSTSVTPRVMQFGLKFLF
jgi:hypothetical protein